MAFWDDWFENEGTDAPQFQKPEIDRNAYNYGGRPDGAARDIESLKRRGDFNRSKQGEYGQQQQGLYNRGNQQMDRGNDAFAQQGLARFSQQQMQEQMAARARGEMGSIAQGQADRQLAQLGRMGDMQRAGLARMTSAQNQAAAAQQASAAAGARGAAGLALAQQGAAANTAAAQQGIGQGAASALANINAQQANASQSISEAAQVNAMQERLAAEQAAFGAAGGIRQGDQGAAALGYQSAGTAFGAGAQSGQLGIQSGQLDLANRGLGHQVNTAQLGASMQREGQESQNALGTMGIQAGVGGQNAQSNQGTFWGLVGAAAGAGQGIGNMVKPDPTSDEAAKVPIRTIGGPSGDAEPGGFEVDPGQLSRFRAPRSTMQGVETTEAEADHTYNSVLATLQASDEAQLTQEQRADNWLGRAENPDLEGALKKTKAPGRHYDTHAMTPKPDEAKQRPWGGGALGNLSQGAMGISSRASMGGYRGPIRSDEGAKLPIGIGPVSAGIEMGGQSVGAPTFDALASGGGMDVMGSLARHSKNATRFISNPGAPAMASGMMGKVPSGMMGKVPSGMVGKVPSDMGAKQPIGTGVIKDAWKQGSPTDFVMAGGGTEFSDERAKSPAGRGLETYKQGVSSGIGDPRVEAYKQGVASGVVPMMDPEGAELHVGANGLAQIARPPAPDDSQNGVPRASFTGPSKVKFEAVPDRAPKAGLAKRAKKKKKQDLGAEADEMLAGIVSRGEARLAAGPSVKGNDMASSNRALRGYPYAYKEGVRPDEQAPGETNVGPMAQQMAMNPIARTAVKRDPQTGMLAIDRDKFAKVQASGLASMQEQHDALARVVGKMRKKGGT